MPHLPSITIITPTYNVAGDIGACIDSVAQQTYPHIEHLIMDGQSTDGTLEEVKRKQWSHRHIRLVSQKDKGIYDAMNKGIDLAQGEYIFFLGADDGFHDARVLESIFGEGGAAQTDLIYGRWKHKGRSVALGRPVDLRFFVFDGNISHQAIFLKKTVLQRLGKFDTRFRLFADWVLNIRCFADSSISKTYVDTVISIYSLEGVSTRSWDPLINNFRVKALRKNFLIDYLRWKVLGRNIGFKHLDRDTRLPRLSMQKINT